MCVNLLPQSTPVLERARKIETLEILDGAIDSHPRHDFRVSELLSPATHLPDALIGFHPDPLQVRDPFALDGCTLFGSAESDLPRLMQCIGHFAVDIELE